MKHHDHEHGFEVVEVLRVALVAIAAIAVWFHLGDVPIPGMPFISPMSGLQRLRMDIDAELLHTIVDQDLSS